MNSFLKKSRFVFVIVALLLVCMLVSCGGTEKYDQANKLFDEGKYSEALTLYIELGSYKDSEARAIVSSAMKDMGKGKYRDTVKSVLSLGVNVTISYDLNGGALVDQKNDKTVFTFTKPTEFRDVKDAEKEGSEFVKWDISKCVFTDKGWELSLKANYQAAEYDIIYNLDGGSIADGFDKYAADVNTTLTAPVKTGYTFIGWTGEGVDEPTLEMVIPVGSMGEKTFTAHWRANSYSVVLNANGGELDEDDVADLVYGESYLLPSADKFGYKFAGWYAGETKVESAGLWNIADDITLTAKWEEKLFISFIGDSISTYEGYSNNTLYNENLGLNNAFYGTESATKSDLESVMETYWMLAVEELGLELCVPNGCGASRVTDTVKDVYPDDIIPSGPERANDLDRVVNGETINPDIIFVYLGTNDLGYSFPDANQPDRYVPISTQLFTNAYSAFIDSLKANYPDAKIYVGTLTPMKHNNREIPLENYSAFNAAIKSVASAKGVEVIDLAVKAGITWDNFASYTCDNLHPNKAGMQMIADCIIDAIAEDFDLK